MPYASSLVEIGTLRYRNAFVYERYRRRGGGRLAGAVPGFPRAGFEESDYLLPYPYPTPFSLDERVDHRYTAGATLLRRFGDSLRIGGHVVWARRVSNLPDLLLRRPALRPHRGGPAMKRPSAERRKRLLVLASWTPRSSPRAYAGAYLDPPRPDPLPGGLDCTSSAPSLTVVVAKALVFALAGTYRGLMLYATLPDLLTIVRNTTLASVAVFALFNVLPGHRPYSRGVLVIDWMLTIGLLWPARAWPGACSARGSSLLALARGAVAKRVLIVGAGRAGVALAKDLMADRRGGGGAWASWTTTPTSRTRRCWAGRSSGTTQGPARDPAPAAASTR